MKNENSFIMRPTVDFCFKELMESGIVRKGFIAAVLGLYPEDVVRTELLPTHLRKEYPEDKLGILDVRVVLNGNVQIDMEIQVARFPLWPERSLFYLSKIYSGQIRSGKDYKVLKKCIHVGILDFVLFEEDQEYASQFHLWEDHRRRLYSDKLEVHIVELPKAAKGEYPDTPLLKWAKFIRAETKEEFEMIAKTDPYINEAYEELQRISADDEKRLEYEARQKAILDHNYLMSYNWEDGYSHGKKEGEKLGEKHGEKKKLINLVIKKMKKGCDVPQIADMLEEDEPVIREIYDAAMGSAPDYDIDQVMRRLDDL